MDKRYMHVATALSTIMMTLALILTSIDNINNDSTSNDDIKLIKIKRGLSSFNSFYVKHQQQFNYIQISFYNILESEKVIKSSTMITISKLTFFVYLSWLSNRIYYDLI